MTFPHCFITGTDTDAGKTVATSALLRYLSNTGSLVAGVKPLASGFNQVDGEWLNEDIRSLKAASSVVLPDSLVNQYAYKPAIAPHIAAGFEGQAICFDTISNAVERAKHGVETLLVEGVGGWAVPLANCSANCTKPCSVHGKKNIASLAKSLQLPVVLVVGMKLGCLNHALLTVESIKNSGLQLLGWVACHNTPNFECALENMQTLRDLIGAPLMFEVPYLAIEDELNHFVPDNVSID